MPLPDWDALDAVLAPHTLGIAPGELHGLLSGWLAGGGTGKGWLAQVLADADPDIAALEDAPVLQAMRDATRDGLDDGELGFDLLLPDDDASLQARSAAAFDWCRGFLGGYGLSPGGKRVLSEDAQEALQDIARLAQAVPDDSGDEDEEDEQALVEIVEYLRVAALLIAGDCRLPPAQVSTTVH